MLQDLYDSEINIKIVWQWDSGIGVCIGNGIYDEDKNWEASTTTKTVDEAEEWLKQKAIDLYPDSYFAKKYIKEYKLPGQDEILDKLNKL